MTSTPSSTLLIDSSTTTTSSFSPRPSLPSHQSNPRPPSQTTRPGPSTSTYTFPPSHSFPALYTLQPNPTTRLAQFQKWSRIITSYCSHHRIFTLSLPHCLSLPLFKNQSIKRRLDEPSLREILNWMSSSAEGANGGGGSGGKRVEWIVEPKGGGRSEKVYVFWKRPEEWADVVYGWVEGTGQKGSVLTVWEMLEGEAARGEEFWGMDREIFQRALMVLVKRGKAQVFGEDEGRGVKFF